MIEVKNLTKKYGNFLAVSDLSFEIEKGHVYGFLGPNGAGKSTTMNIITGCLSLTEGTVLVGGCDIFENPKEAKKLIGYLPEIPPLYVDQTPREYLEFVAEAKGIKRADIESELEKVIAETHIEDVAGKLIKNLSKGYKQRVGIAQALLGNPEVIILDEPTVGLDPMQIIEIRDLIKELGESHTVILSSHILSEVEAICDRVLIINKGKLVAFDEPSKLRETLANKNTIEVKIEASENEFDEICQKLSNISSVEKEKIEENLVEAVLTVDEENPEAVCRELFFLLSKEGKPCIRLNPIKASLEDIFIELTEGESNESSI